MCKALNNVCTMKSIATRLAGVSRHAGIWTAAWAATGAMAQRVNDLPGGPEIIYACGDGEGAEDEEEDEDDSEEE